MTEHVNGIERAKVREDLSADYADYAERRQWAVGHAARAWGQYRER